MANGLKTALLLGLLSAVLLATRRDARRRERPGDRFVFAAVMNLGSYWFSDKIVLRMYRAQPKSGPSTSCTGSSSG